VSMANQRPDSSVTSQSLPRRSVVFSALAGAVVAAGLLFGGAGSARAEDPGPKAEVIVIHATHCKEKRIDPEAKVAPSMGFECLRTLDRKLLPLVANHPSTVNLPNGRIFTLAYNGRERDRHKLTASLNPPDGGAQQVKLADIVAEANKPFNVGGLTHQGGVLILMVKVIP
jgi:hypothetical protein